MVPDPSAVRLAKYSFGAGDRFGLEGRAQLAAFREARSRGAEVAPVWNKSHREHAIIGSSPAQTRAAAEAAVRESGWEGPWHVDADHITLKTVDPFLDACDYFTLDVAEEIGRPADEGEVRDFVDRHGGLEGRHRVPFLEEPLLIRRSALEEAARGYLPAVRAAGRIYRRIEERRGAGRFAVEVSMDETDRPQTAVDLLAILAGLAEEGVPVQAIAPRFPGRFNKGVDYGGDPARFEREFLRHAAAIALAVREYGLPAGLKISVHSGSDKFSIYPAIRRALRRTGAGLHLKTAGTTWLEELAGLAEAGGEGLALARGVYEEAHGMREALVRPYAAVVEIDPARLPPPAEVGRWGPADFVSALQHDPSCPAFNPHFRQLLHVAYGVAARRGEEFRGLLKKFAEVVGRRVTRNLFERHLRPIFLGD